MGDKGYYSEYLTTRKPSSFGERMLRDWHLKLLNRAISTLNLSEECRILEVGAGHGLFADAVTNAGLSYQYVDISQSVSEHMAHLGFQGFCGNITKAPTTMNNFDVVWMSHVLEHSPNWVSARELVEGAMERLRPGGYLVVVSPDLLSSKMEFWNSDWSHGYPTSRRNVVQLMSDVGLEVVQSEYHRGASFFPLGRATRAVLSAIPHSLIDLAFTPHRHRRGEGYFYSWKTVFGWRQIFVAGRRK